MSLSSLYRNAMSLISPRARSDTVATTLADRGQICRSTIAMTADIVEQETPRGATTDSDFIVTQLPALHPAQSPGLALKPVIVRDADTFTVARDLIRTFRSDSSDTPTKRIAILNLASDEQRAGGWVMSLSKTQEEALCYSSTLYSTLKLEYYPWPNTGPGSIAGIYSPGIVIFRGDLDYGCQLLSEEERLIVAVITVAAPRWPELNNNSRGFKHASDLENLREKIKLVYRMAASNGHTDMVLGAMGCGAYGCPREIVAREMKAILEEREFEGFFENVCFAVYARGRGGQANFDAFREAFSSE